jgi:hypothetical protein
LGLEGLGLPVGRHLLPQDSQEVFLDIHRLDDGDPLIPAIKMGIAVDGDLVKSYIPGRMKNQMIRLDQTTVEPETGGSISDPKGETLLRVIGNPPGNVTDLKIVRAVNGDLFRVVQNEYPKGRGLDVCGNPLAHNAYEQEAPRGTQDENFRDGHPLISFPKATLTTRLE